VPVAGYTSAVLTQQAQLDAARTGALVVFRPDLAAAVVRGNDRVAWLNGMLTCDVTRAASGVAMYGLAVTQKGRVIADVIVIAEAAALRLVVPRAVLGELIATLERYIIMEDAEVAATGDVVALACGPRAATIGGAGVLSAAFDELGFGGSVLLFEGDAAASAVDVARGSLEWYDALRVELGVPRFGVDFDQTTYPQEALLERRAVSFDKGCYIGQEVVFMLEVRGRVKRKLAKITIDAQVVPAPGTEVCDASGVAVGTLTSVARGPISGAVVGLAMVKIDRAGVDTELVIGGASARVVA
jgi:hypothetical protein